MRLYLDIDGVLHGNCSGKEYVKICSDGSSMMWFDNWFEWAPILANILNDFPEVEVYVISTWRYLWEDIRPQELVEALGLGDKYIRNVPTSIYGDNRQNLIIEDMKRDNYNGAWIALDDSGPDYPDKTKLIQTNPETGIKDVKILLQLLHVLCNNRVKANNEHAA